MAFAPNAVPIMAQPMQPMQPVQPVQPAQLVQPTPVQAPCKAVDFFFHSFPPDTRPSSLPRPSLVLTRPLSLHVAGEHGAAESLHAELLQSNDDRIISRVFFNVFLWTV